MTSKPVAVEPHWFPRDDNEGSAGNADFSFAEGAELRLLETITQKSSLSLIDQNRSYLRQWLPEGDVYNSVDSRGHQVISLGQLAANAGFTLGIRREEPLGGIVGAGQDRLGKPFAMVGDLLGETYQEKAWRPMPAARSSTTCSPNSNFTASNRQCSTDNVRSRAVPNGSASRKRACCARLQAFDNRFLDLEVQGMLAEEWKRATE